jgi:hypothetical protein
MSRITSLILAGFILATLMLAGCQGILSETASRDGQVERVRLDTGSKWSKWDRNPTKAEDSCLMLKSEKTF